MAGKSLQAQGVPVPDRLRGPNVEKAQPATRPRSAQMATRSRGNTQRRNSSGNRRRSVGSINADYNPVNVAEKGSNSVGALEAEFLVGLGLLILLMFASSASYSDKIMSVMKRGALMCVLFFILALVSSAGPNAAKIAKAFGALVIIAILVTSPVNTVVSDLDNLIKNDWVGSSETAGDSTNASASSGTQQSSPNTGNLGQDFINALEQELKLQGQQSSSNSNPVSKQSITTDIKNALTSTLNGIIPGSGSILSKLGL